jgi:hypothetical protein
VVEAGPDIYNHNLETVPGLYLKIRPEPRYFASLRLLQKVKELSPTMFTKSGIMVGLGEEREEVLQVMDDLRAADVDFLTIGQYLQPDPQARRGQALRAARRVQGAGDDGAGQGLPAGLGQPADALRPIMRARTSRGSRRRGSAPGADLAGVRNELRVPTPSCPRSAPPAACPSPSRQMFDLVADVEQVPEVPSPVRGAHRQEARARG